MIHIHNLTKREVPNGSLLLWASDVHIPIHHDPAVRLMCEAAEWAGVTHNIAGGDVLDLHIFSKHKQDPERLRRHPDLLSEVEPGRWYLDWLATRPCHYIMGNHEDRLKRYLAEPEQAGLWGNDAVALATLAKFPKGIQVHPQGGEVRLGNLVMEHLDALLKNSTGGPNPAGRILTLAPDQSTLGGHVHRISQMRRTSFDKYGIKRTRAAWTMGHMSMEEHHHDYVSKNPNWQMGFGLIRVFWEGDSPRWNVYQVEVLFDRKNRPYFELFGKVFR